MRLFYHNRDYLLSTIVAVAGFNPVTFNAMRRRNGFLGHREKKGSWARYSIADICAAQAARELVDKGVSTQLAVDVANKLTARFECLDNEEAALEFYDKRIAVVTGKPRDSISLSFHNTTEVPLSSAVIAVVDLYDIQMRTLDALIDLGADRLVDGRKAVFGALAEATGKLLADWQAEDDLPCGSGDLTSVAPVIGSTAQIGRNTLAELPRHLRKPNLRRREASEYLDFVYGIRCATATLNKMATLRTGPNYRKYNNSPVYPVDELDAWAQRKLGQLRSSSSDPAHDDRAGRD